MSASPLNDIAHLLASVDTLSPEAQEMVRDQIQGVRRSMESAPSELLGCLDAAATLVGSLPHLEERAASEVQEMVARLIDLVAASCAETEAAAAMPVADEPTQLDSTRADEASLGKALAQHPLSPDPVSTEPLAPQPTPPTPPPVAPPPVDESLELVAPDELDEFGPDAALSEAEEEAMLAELDEDPLPIPVAAPMPAPMPVAEPTPTPAPAPTASVDYSVPKLNDMMLGEVMIQLGFVGKGEVDTALRRMADYGQRFGEALIEIGAATAEDVAQGISLQRLLSQGAQHAQHAKFERASVLHGILLGEILVLMGRITRDQLKQGLEHQSLTGSRIGEALVELRFITWKDLDEAIRIQHARGGSSELNDSSTMVELEDRE